MLDRSSDAAFDQTLERVVRLIGEGTDGSPVVAGEADAARRSAAELFRAAGRDDLALRLAALHFAAILIAAIAVDLVAEPLRLRRTAARLHAGAGIPSGALGGEVLRTPRLDQIPPLLGAEVQLATLLAFSGVSVASLWTLGAGGEPRMLARVGATQPDAAGRALARELLAGTSSLRRGAGEPAGASLIRTGRPPCAVLTAGVPAEEDHRSLLLDAAMPVFGALLDRMAFDARGVSEAVTILERRLARLRFDVHDGPQQDLHLLAIDLRLFRDQLRPIVTPGPIADRLLGRLDDLEAQLVALDSDLRRILSMLQLPRRPPAELPRAVGELTDAFTVRTGIEPSTDITGDLTRLTDSQQIVLLALVRESLSNVLKHSRARRVRIAISAGPNGIVGRVTDDGRGFDPELTLVRAAREGHLGLVGIHERVRMLGGEVRIESRVGGPTAVSLEMPSWPSEG